MGKVQGEVFAGFLGHEGLLHVDALLGKASVTIKASVVCVVAAAEGEALGSVLAQAGDLEEVFLVQADIVQTQAVSIRRGLWFPTTGLESNKRFKMFGKRYFCKNRIFYRSDQWGYDPCDPYRSDINDPGIVCTKTTRFSVKTYNLR